MRRNSSRDRRGRVVRATSPVVRDVVRDENLARTTQRHATTRVAPVVRAVLAIPYLFQNQIDQRERRSARTRSRFGEQWRGSRTTRTTSDLRRSNLSPATWLRLVRDSGAARTRASIARTSARTTLRGAA